MAPPPVTMLGLPSEVLQLIAVRVDPRDRICHLPLISKHWRDSLAGPSSCWVSLRLQFNMDGTQVLQQNAMLRWLYPRAAAVTSLSLDDYQDVECGACSALLLVHRTLQSLTMEQVGQQATIEQISACTALTHLDLDGVEDLQLGCLSRLVNLQALTSPCPAGALHSFLQLTRLTNIQLYDIKDALVARPEYAQHNLQTVHFSTDSDCNIPIALLAGWSNLTRLSLKSSSASRASIVFEPASEPGVQLSNLCSLKQVILEAGALGAVPDCLLALHNLQQLSIDVNHGGELQLPAGLSALRSLAHLNLLYPSFQGGRLPAVMAQLRSLKSLVLWHVPDLDSANVFGIVSRLPLLDSLVLHFCPTPFAMCAADIANLPCIREVELNRFLQLCIRPAGAEALARHPTLRRVRLAGSVIVPAALQDFLVLAESLGAAGQRNLLTFKQKWQLPA